MIPVTGKEDVGMPEGVCLHEVGRSEVEGHEVRQIAAPAKPDSKLPPHHRSSAIAGNEIVAENVFFLAGAIAQGYPAEDTVIGFPEFGQLSVEVKIDAVTCPDIVEKRPFDLMLSGNRFQVGRPPVFVAGITAGPHRLLKFPEGRKVNAMNNAPGQRRDIVVVRWQIRWNPGS